MEEMKNIFEKMEKCCNDIFNLYKKNEIRKLKDYIKRGYNNYFGLDNFPCSAFVPLIQDILQNFLTNGNYYSISSKQQNDGNAQEIEIDGVAYSVAESNDKIYAIVEQCDIDKSNIFNYNDKIFIIDESGEICNTKDALLFYGLHSKFSNVNKYIKIDETLKHDDLNYMQTYNNVKRKIAEISYFQHTKVPNSILNLSIIELGAVFINELQDYKMYFNIIDSLYKKIKYLQYGNLSKAFKIYKKELIEFSIDELVGDIDVVADKDAIKNTLLNFKGINFIARTHISSLATQGLYKQFPVMLCIDYAVIAVGYFKIVELVFSELLQTYWSNNSITNKLGETISNIGDEYNTIGKMMQIYYAVNQNVVEYFKRIGFDVDNMTNRLNLFIKQTRNGYVHKHIMEDKSLFDTAKKEAANLIALLIQSLKIESRQEA